MQVFKLIEWTTILIGVSGGFIVGSLVGAVMIGISEFKAWRKRHGH